MKCPEFTSYHKGLYCELADVVTNEKYLRRYNLEPLQESLLQNCIRVDSHCSQHFLRIPYKLNNATNDRFIFMSASKPYHPSEHREFITKDNNENGHIFINLPDGSQINAGKSIEYVKFFERSDQAGLLIKYSSSSICPTDKNKTIQTFLIMVCNKLASEAPKVVDNHSNSILFYK